MGLFPPSQAINLANLLLSLQDKTDVVHETIMKASAVVTLYDELTLERDQRTAVDPNASEMLSQVELFLTHDEDVRATYESVCAHSKKLKI